MASMSQSTVARFNGQVDSAHVMEVDDQNWKKIISPMDKKGTGKISFE